MTVYGNFEAVKQVFRTTHGSIWSARAKETADSPDCGLKLLQLNDAMIERRDTTAAQNLLVAAALQQAMGNKSELWAPIYGLGSQGTNAFYVTWLFPRSAQTLIDNKVDLTATELRTLLLAIVDGLLDLQTAFHRSHGNLKPSNVLISDRSRIREREILLTDPDASAEDVPSMTRTPDQKALGEILYALVTHKPGMTARVPLPKSDKWKQIGSTGKQWYSLCESLLSTVTRRGTLTLEQVRDRIAAIDPTRRQAPKIIFAGLLLAVAAGAGYTQRAKLPGLYEQGSTKLMAVLHSTMRPPTTTLGHPTTAPTLVSQYPMTVQTSRITSPTFIPPVAKADPVKVADIPPVVKPPVFIPPPQIRFSGDVEGKKTVQNTTPPEFHSDRATAEFISRRDLFVTNYPVADSGTALTNWTKVMAGVQTLDTDYPAPDPAATPNWPAGLEGVITARRDASLVRAIDSAFDQQRADPASYQNTLTLAQTATAASGVAHDALARGDIEAAQKAIDQCNAALKQFPATDGYLVDLFDPSVKQFAALAAVSSSDDRHVLLDTADNESAMLAVRLAAWLRAPAAAGPKWPADLPSLAADSVRARRLNTLLQEVGSIDIAKQTASTEDSRWSDYYSSLKDEKTLVAALTQAHDPQFISMMGNAPVWFRYDMALYVLKTTLPAQVTSEQKKTYTDLAGQVNAPAVQLVHDVLEKAAKTTIPTLGQSGPGSIKGWKLRGGSTKERCTYVSPSATTSLEFLHVHLPGDAQGIDCYLCTTETPVSLLQDLLNNTPTALAAAEAMNNSPIPVNAGMQLWSFDDKAAAVKLDADDYSKCFVVGPKETYPAQMVTPQLAFYIARRVGCRLPNSKEWLGAFAQAKNSTDDNMKGFAIMGWKLRDQEYAKLLKNPSRDPDCWPDDNIFMGDLNPATIPHQGSAVVWNNADLEKLGAYLPNAPAAGPLSSLQSSTGFGFRPVSDENDFGGVFHDLIGNVAEYVMDAPVILGESVSVAPTLSTADAVRSVDDWMTAEHLKTVSVIGGSAVSPPQLDPLKPYPLPAGQNKFSDVGFRLAFTDPACLPNAQREILGQAPYITAP